MQGIPAWADPEKMFLYHEFTAEPDHDPDCFAHFVVVLRWPELPMDPTSSVAPEAVKDLLTLARAAWNGVERDDETAK